MSIDINGKIALVTGANRGIGKAIVDSLIEHGASKVYLAVRNPESTVEQAKQYGDKVVTLQADVGDDASISALAQAAQDVNIVINNAGVVQPAELLSADAFAALKHELNVNTYGLLRVAQAFAPVLQQNGGGAFVQLNSVASIKNFTPFTTYSASKAATYSITQGLKDVMAPLGIAVLSVHPGPIATDMGDQVGMTEVAEPANVVAEGIVSALKAGDFHLFPDTMAKQFGDAYDSYAQAIINGQ